MGYSANNPRHQLFHGEIGPNLFDFPVNVLWREPEGITTFKNGLTHLPGLVLTAAEMSAQIVRP
jgi:hypothetical protein